MNAVEFVNLCLQSHDSDTPIAMIIDGVPVSLMPKQGPHLRVPKGCMTDELKAINGHGSSIVFDAPDGEVRVAAHVELHFSGSKREMRNENNYMIIQPSKISLATLGRFGKESTMLIKGETA